MRNVRQVAVDLDDVEEAGPHRCERGRQVLEHLLGLRPEVAARELAVGSGAELA